MSNAFDRAGFEASVLYSDEDYEPYGYVSPQLAPVAGAAGHGSICPYEREIEEAVLHKLDAYPGC
jgi:hypothetical protein